MIWVDILGWIGTAILLTVWISTALAGAQRKEKMIKRSKHWELVNLLQEVHGDSYTLGYLGSIFQHNVKWTDDFEERLADLQEKSIQIQKERNR